MAKTQTYTIHFNATSSDRPDMLYDKARSLRNAIKVCDYLMKGSRLKAWVCANVKKPSPWNPDRITDHSIAVYCNFHLEPTLKTIYFEQAASHNLVFVQSSE